MADEDFAKHPHWAIFVAAYRQFQDGKPGATLALLEPVIERDESANHPSLMAGVMWGLAGDCYFRLDEPDKGFRAYRRAIELDGAAGCLTLFACQVAWHRRAEYAEEALGCLRASRAADWRALRQHPLHFLWHCLGVKDLYFRFVRVPLARRQLHRLVAQARNT